MIKFLSKVTLIAISSFGFFYSSQASENTIEGYWFASGSLIEIKVCEELICAEIVHVISANNCLITGWLRNCNSFRN